MVIVQQPNFYGIIEDYSGFNDLINNNNSLFIMNVDPATLPVLKHRENGQVIACGDATARHLRWVVQSVSSLQPPNICATCRSDLRPNEGCGR